MSERRGQAWLLAAAAMLLMSACGGGSDPHYDVKAAMGHWLNDAGSWALTGTAPDGQKYALTVASAPLPPALTPIVGAMAARSQQTFTATVDGATFDGATTFYFEPANLAFFGSDNGTGSCDVTETNTPLPNSASAGMSGAIYTDSVYDGCTSGATVVSTAKGDWSLQSSGGMVMLCWTATVLDLTGTELATQATCIQVAPDGTLGSKASLVVTFSGVTLLDARNF